MLLVRVVLVHASHTKRSVLIETVKSDDVVVLKAALWCFSEKH